MKKFGLPESKPVSRGCVAIAHKSFGCCRVIADRRGWINPCFAAGPTFSFQQQPKYHAEPFEEERCLGLLLVATQPDSGVDEMGARERSWLWSTSYLGTKEKPRTSPAQQVCVSVTQWISLGRKGKALQGVDLMAWENRPDQTSFVPLKPGGFFHRSLLPFSRYYCVHAMDGFSRRPRSVGCFGSSF